MLCMPVTVLSRMLGGNLGTLRPVYDTREAENRATESAALLQIVAAQFWIFILAVAANRCRQWW